jgi:hypothetical protein
VVQFIAFDPPLQKLQCVSLSKTLVSYLGQKWFFCTWNVWGEGIPCCTSMPRVQCNWWLLDLSLNLHSMASWNSHPRAIKGTSYNWFRLLKPKWTSGLNICKFYKLYLGIIKVINISHRLSWSILFLLTPHCKKLKCVSLSKTLVSYLGKIWCFWPWDIKGGRIHSCNYMPWLKWNQWFLDSSLS